MFFLQPGSIPRTFAAAMTAALLVAVTAASQPAADGWREAPEFVRLFAPAAHRGAYQASVSADGLDTVLMSLAGDASLVRSPGAWVPQTQPPLDAFGRSGAYDRWKLARLYGSRQPRVARGARSTGGGLLESWTLVSPYPSADFTRLEPGTLRIVLRTP
jgi:hypothetical protein